MYPNRNFPPAVQRSPKPQESSPLCPDSGPACHRSGYQKTLNKLWKVPFSATSHITKWCTRAAATGRIVPKFPSMAEGWWDLALGGHWGLFGVAGWNRTLFWSSPKEKGVVGTWAGPTQVSTQGCCWWHCPGVTQHAAMARLTKGERMVCHWLLSYRDCAPGLLQSCKLCLCLL